ncbi:triose-phosphate isomerase [Halomonas sp. 328]|uniref:triose-phosphate isomerase n=1 Tax=Halomonas sp. 328 TaxID=2776704 RepID=UPI0018A780B4|nr:triose-phosphate isomerase [Halomonas sp. 328]MBF8222228.1 triose-phosphate isomerase [Halomonas sp. 328]
MSRPRVIGNWKLNGSRARLERWLERWQAHGTPRHSAALCLPFPYLAMAHQPLAEGGLNLGAQDLSEADAGAYTGEVSAAMLRECGCQLVLVGHSERRQRAGDDDTRIAAKVARALAEDLTPVLCLGETLEQRRAGHAERVILEQVKPTLETIAPADLPRVMIAYEPIWAIGSGLTASPDQAEAVHRTLRQRLHDHAGETAARVTLLYGGSVTPENAGDLFARESIDGALVGGASLDADAFHAICDAF